MSTRAAGENDKRAVKAESNQEAHGFALMAVFRDSSGCSANADGSFGGAPLSGHGLLSPLLEPPELVERRSSVSAVPSWRMQQVSLCAKSLPVSLNKVALKRDIWGCFCRAPSWYGDIII